MNNRATMRVTVARCSSLAEQTFPCWTA